MQLPETPTLAQGDLTALLGLGKAVDSVLGASGLPSIPGLVPDLPTPALEAQVHLLSSVSLISVLLKHVCCLKE